MKQYNRIMLGKHGRYIKDCLANNYIGAGFLYDCDLSKFPYDNEALWRKKLIEKYQEENDQPRRAAEKAIGALWTICFGLKKGDIVLTPDGNGNYHVGEITGDYYYFQSKDLPNRRHVNWKNVVIQRDAMSQVLKKSTGSISTCCNITKYSVELEELITGSKEGYSKTDFLKEVYMNEDSYDTLKYLVEKKQNVILQGAPGVGKTFVAKLLAYSIMGKRDPNRIKMVQFHQSYSYEDFIMGFRPSEKGFELKCGAFYNFCKLAKSDINNKYFFIIDEINRGNLSKIFGELFMLIESDKRGVELPLLYSDENFSVPGNIYIIGLMNTADRSLAMLDYALRRRFAFYEMEPGFETDGFQKYQKGLNSSKFDELIKSVLKLNEEIEKDDSLGKGFCIGHSYFCNLEDVTDQSLAGIVKYELIPLLEEYWYDDRKKMETWTEILKNAIK